MSAMAPPAAGSPAAEVGSARPATEPPEARGLARDEVRLLVGSARDVSHARFRDLPRFLGPGDLLVVNVSTTLPAAVDAVRAGGGEVVVHFSTAFEDGSWAVEVRPRVRAKGPIWEIPSGERILFAGGGEIRLGSSYPEPGVELSRLRIAVPTRIEIPALLRREGRPIAYSYMEGRWALSYYRTVFGIRPGSAEMPSAGRPFSHRLVTRLVSKGVEIAPVLLHTGVSSQEGGEPPLPEPFHVPAATAARVNEARRRGNRVIAVGTTSARALESAADLEGRVSPAGGWTDLVLGPERPARVLDGLITGWHEAGASHLSLLESVVEAELIREAYQEALRAGYLWHEFGDSCLLLREP